jgi:methylmalonyl-CoA mutase N-terminal domain/subunit
MVACIERGLIQGWISESAFRWQKEVDAGERTIVGVNKYAGAPAKPQKLFSVDPKLADRQIERLARVKKERDAARVADALARLKAAAGGTDNLMPLILEAAEAYATVGEITGVLREVFGEFREPVSF